MLAYVVAGHTQSRGRGLAFGSLFDRQSFPELIFITRSRVMAVDEGWSKTTRQYEFNECFL